MTDEELIKQEERSLAEIEKSIDAVIRYNKSAIPDFDKQISDYCVSAKTTAKENHKSD